MGLTNEFGSHVGLIAKLRLLIFHRVHVNNHWVYGRYIWGSKEICYLDDLGCASQSRFVGMLTSPAKKSRETFEELGINQ